MGTVCRRRRAREALSEQANTQKSGYNPRRGLRMATSKNHLEMLHRYTDLTATLHLLRAKTITLLDPEKWNDRNDAHFMAEYKRAKSAKSVLALCFAERNESYHHWRVFSHGSDGVRIEFDKEMLLSTFAKDDRVKMGYVRYKKVEEVRQSKFIKIESLPFLKRFPYEDEGEFRIIYVDNQNPMDHKDYRIEIDWIRRITLSPWIHKDLYKSVKLTLRAIEGCSGLKISRSTLIENEKWQRLASKAR
jgi:hypothetical protein